MEALLFVPAALVVAAAGVLLCRARADARDDLIDLADPSPPVVDLDYLQSGSSRSEPHVTSPVMREGSLGARLLAADRARQRERERATRRRRRGEQLTADR